MRKNNMSAEKLLDGIIPPESVAEAMTNADGMVLTASEVDEVSNFFNPFEVLHQSVKEVVKEIGTVDHEILQVLQKHLKTPLDLDDNNLPRKKRKVSKTK